MVTATKVTLADAGRLFHNNFICLERAKPCFLAISIYLVIFYRNQFSSYRITICYDKLDCILTRRRMNFEGGTNNFVQITRAILYFSQ